MSAAPVIIEAAINGATTKERNPNVPRTPDEIATDALAAIEAGAAVIHNHIDLGGLSEAGAGRPSGRPAVPDRPLRAAPRLRAPHPASRQWDAPHGPVRPGLGEPRP